MPRWVVPALVVLTALALVPVVLVAKARVSTSKEPRLHLVHDMDHQEKYKPQQRNSFFREDGQAMRLPVPGTVARGELGEDDHLQTGKVDGKYATTWPKAVRLTMDFLRRGRERYDVFCATCHGYDGSGKGPTSVRAEEPQVIEEGVWVPVPSYHEERVRERELGHLYYTIRNGYPHEGEKNMQAYGPQIPVLDRWAIVAYVKALIRSRAASIEDVPPELRDQVK
jgi:mono/diheme cytochrome c family protein